ncbi:hypothetical protein GCM10017783_05540 [Deinococcus piscis]|uniref:Uncharacterized protein n=1 Tax=Deinococcus piscis TaxID=394230 RepID=A0ABQ3K0H3_9DEIO|nr:hypothetical protein [Deinococcus piscis]GHF96560.1 hypothetical protein GCM10017783_05540 [Deinococcus piscis]
MGRHERFSQYQWAAWPDEGLCRAAEHLFMPYITRIEQRLDGLTALVIELEGEYFADTEQVRAKYEAYGGGVSGPKRALRLSWEDGWEERDGGLNRGGVTVYRSERIFFLETYEEFYAGPFGTFHPSRQGVSSPDLYEVVNEPDPWVMEILCENRNTDTFPPYGPTVLEYHRATDTFSGGGRFASSESHRAHDYFWTGEQPPTPEQRAEFEAAVERNDCAQAELDRSRPRYRHLFIASNSVMVEILCEGLPRWEWVEIPEDA